MGVCVCSLAGTAACMRCPNNPAAVLGPMQEPWNRQNGWDQIFPQQPAPNSQPVVPQRNQEVEELRKAHNELCEDVKQLRAEQAVVLQELKWATDKLAKLLKKGSKKK